jgi:ribosomal protein S18 acetylase RimI-like enzyme
MDVRLRPMTAADKPSVMALLEATPEFEPEEIPVAEEVIDFYLDCPGRDYLINVAESSSGIIGYVCFGQSPLTLSTWDIYWMAVSLECRGMGAGGMLLRDTEEEIQKGGGKLALIETSSKPNYLNTRRFYIKKGYKRVSRIRDFYAPGDHRLIFEKRFP